MEEKLTAGATGNIKRRQQLGAFYTPPVVVRLILSLIKVLLELEEEFFGRWRSRGHHPSVIDPAAGEGIFLLEAVRLEITEPQWVFGVDIDAEVISRWKEVGILELFGGDENEMKAHFFNQNSLIPLNWSEFKAHYNGKLKKRDIAAQQFDVVVGNPPFGKLFTRTAESEEQKFSERVLQELSKYEILKLARLRSNGKTKPQNNPHTPSCEQHHLFHNVCQNDSPIGLNDTLRALQNIPAEVLFIERFIQLAKNGGLIGIVVPESILSNTKLEYVREFILQKCRIFVIVLLPPDTFHARGANANTGFIIMQKKPVNPSYELFKNEEPQTLIVNLNSISLKNLSQQIIDALVEEFYANLREHAERNKKHP